MKVLTIRGGQSLSGLAVAPPDKSITHRAFLLAALGEGRAEIAPLSAGADNRSTLSALRGLGAQIEVDERAKKAWVQGVGGPRGFKNPGAPIDCGNSGTTMRLLTGLLAGSRLSVMLTGDHSLSSRPMSRILLLEAMGARFEGTLRDGRLYPPLTVHGAGENLTGVEHRLPIASAQVKSALLLAGLWAKGRTVVREPARSRDHTERMLRALGVSLVEEPDGALIVTPLVRPWSVDRFAIAPDFSSAAFLLGAALLTNSPELRVETAINPTRTGFLDALRGFGVEVEIEPRPDCGGEPIGRIHLRAPQGGLRGTQVAGDLTLRSIDEVPLIAALAAFANGRTEIRDAGELRVKESDRLRAMAELLSAFGASVSEMPDGLTIEGAPNRLHGAKVEGGWDHRIAMCACILGLGSPGVTEIAGADIIDVSYPDFAAELSRVGARVEEHAA